MSSTVPESIQIMKFRASRKLKNIILSIIFAILTFLSCLSNFLKFFRVGRYENLFIFFWMAIKIAGLAQKTGSIGLAETQVFFLGLNNQFCVNEACEKLVIQINYVLFLTFNDRHQNFHCFDRT